MSRYASRMLFYLSMLSLFAFGAILSGQALSPTQAGPSGGISIRGGMTHLERNPLFLIAVGFAIIVVGLRNKVGVDWMNYVRIFQTISRKDFGQALAVTDPAFAFLNWLSHEFGLGIWFVNLTCAMLLCWGIYSYARTQPNPWLVFVVAIPYLVIVVGMNYVRQAVAIGMCLAAIGAMTERSLLRFFFYMVLGALFHKTALIVLPIVAFAYSQNKLLRVGAFMAGVAIGYISLNNTGTYDRLSELYVRSQMVSSGATTRLAMNIMPSLLMITTANIFRFDPVEKRIWTIFSWLAILAAFIGLMVTSTTAVDRLALYLIPLQLAVFGRLPNALSPSFRPSTSITGGIILYSAAVEIMFLTYSDYARYWLPYRSFLY